MKLRKNKIIYSRKYFYWQKTYGNFSVLVDKEKFLPYLNKRSNILDFGCGGAFLLSSLPGKGKIGVEINQIARKQAIRNGIAVLATAHKVKDNWADVIISNHVLEHCENPLSELKILKKKLKKNGKIVFFVPHERNTRYIADDINHHLFTWSELNLGNLFKRAGYRIISVETRKSAWPPYYQTIYRIFGHRIFQFIADIYGKYFSPFWEVQIVATK
ncbi:MAG: class I SAM-dependent methyltransferase [Candidatus Magasanikbacteria bacterium]|nr:class I SAM-dependent methyltransferase [Candidatus Magasanikbacteria bacterium]